MKVATRSGGFAGPGLNGGHVAAMGRYTRDPVLHDAACEGALPVQCDKTDR